MWNTVLENIMVNLGGMNMSKKIRVAVVGCGNLGSYARNAVPLESDMELAAVIDYGMNIDDFLPFDVALLCVPSLSMSEVAEQYMSRKIAVVDSFDFHGVDLWQHKIKLDEIAKKYNTSAIVSAGWDPGLDSIIRTTFALAIPKGITYTDFGPGMSLGHSVAARSVEKVKDAVAVTYPLGSGKHRRIVYVVLEKDADIGKVKAQIAAHPYFCHDELSIQVVDNLDCVHDYGHGAHIERKGIAGNTHNQRMCFSTSLNNPAVTSQIMVMSARAVVKQKPGAYTMIEIPLIDYFSESLERIVKNHL